MSLTRSTNVRSIVLITLLALLAVALLAGAALVVNGAGGAAGNALGQFAISSSCGCSGGWRVICPHVYLCLM